MCRPEGLIGDFAQPGALNTRHGGGLLARERVKEAFHIFRAHADTGILNAEFIGGMAGVRRRIFLNADMDRAAGS